MKRILLKIAYDGTNYCGFQVQPNGITVQEVLNRAISDLTGTPTRTIGASRTDAGVHALGNAAVFDTEARMDGSKYAFALNARLPEDIRITGSREVPLTFHPRYTDTVKTYEYHILNSRFPDPTKRLYSLFCYYHLDTGKMRAALKALEGTHDFRSFQSSAETRPDKNTVRTIYRAELICGDGFGGAAADRPGADMESPGGHAAEMAREDEAARNGHAAEMARPDEAARNGYAAEMARPDEEARNGYHGMMTIRLCGSGFLYNMVRIIAGTVIDVGRGKIPEDAMPGIIAAEDRGAAGPTAPPHGLVLKEIEYPELNR